MKKTYDWFNSYGKNKILTLIILFFFITPPALLLSSCGGSGGNSEGGIPTYIVGGIASGLLGNLILQNNDTDDLTITQNGSFEFVTGLTSGESFNVTVKSHPPGQTCTVTNGNGTINDTNVSDISVDCINGVWTHPTSLSNSISPNGHFAYNPHTAMDDNGNAIIVWEQINGNNSQIFKSEYRNGSWTHPIDLDDNISPDGADAFYPQVEMDNNDNVIITWVQRDGSTRCGGEPCVQVYKSEYRNGIWTHPINLDDNISPDGPNAFSPQVLMDNNGNAIIVWHQEGSGVFKSEYRNESWVHPADLLDRFTDGSYPRAAINNNGVAIIVWRQYDGRNKIFMSEYRSGSWILPSGLTDFISPDGFDAEAGFPHIAMNNNGNIVIVWSQRDGDSPEIYMSEYRSGSWKHPANLQDYISLGNYDPDLSYPQVSMDDNDNTLIVWRQADMIFKSEYRGESWSHPTDYTDAISRGGWAYDTDKPQIAMDNNGNSVIVWHENNYIDFQVFKSEYRNGGWIHPSSLYDNISLDGQDAYNPQIDMDNNGNTLIVWSQYDGSYSQIFKSEFR